MSEFGDLWKHENNQHALVPLKTECGCRGGGGIKNGHMRYPPTEERRKKEKKKNLHVCVWQVGHLLILLSFDGRKRWSAKLAEISCTHIHMGARDNWVPVSHAHIHMGVGQLGPIVLCIPGAGNIAQHA